MEHIKDNNPTNTNNETQYVYSANHSKTTMTHLKDIMWSSIQTYCGNKLFKTMGHFMYIIRVIQEI